MWQPGEQIVIDEIWNGKLWSRRPVVVVEDRPSRLVIWCPKGTVRLVPTTPPTRPRAPTRTERLMACLHREDWVLVEHEWDVSTLWLMEPGRWHSTWVSFLDDGRHWGWYVNLQRPFTRTDGAVQTMDLMLDVLIAPDGSSWRWKDEDEFDAMIEWGLLGPDEVDAVRTEAAAVIRASELKLPPFSEPWGHWTPDPTWPIPSLDLGER